MKGRIVLGYAGGGDVAMAVRQLADVYGADVVTLTLDLGQGRDLEEVRDRALVAGAVRAHVLDVREEFARDFVLPALRAGVSQAGRPLAVALGQPLVAKQLVEVAAIEEARSIAHGGLGQDRERLQASLAALDATVRTITMPLVTGSSDEPQANLWGSVHLARRPSPRALDTPASVEIAFDRGVPTAINGVSMPLAELIESLSIIGGRHGVGRMAMAEDALGTQVGNVHRGRVYEAPAAVILHAAQRALETAVVPPELLRIQRDQAETYAQLVYGGRWFTEARKALDAFNARVQPMVTGIVRIKLFEGELLSSSPVALGVAAVSGS